MARGIIALILLAFSIAHAGRSEDGMLDPLLAEARKAQARSDFRGAAASYQQAVALHPEIAELWANLGLMRHESGEHGQAAKAFRKALQLKPALFAPNLFLGLDLLELNQAREATAFLLAAQKIDPRDPQAHLALGRASHMLRDYAKSRTWYARATVDAPGSGEAWFGLGMAHLELAEAAGAELAKSHRNSIYFADLRAGALAEQGQWKQAQRGYRALMASGTVPRCAHAAFGFVLLQNQNAQEAEHEFQRDLTACPAARVGLARLKFEGGARNEALDELGEFRRSDRNAFEAALPQFWSGLDRPRLEALSAELVHSTDVVAAVIVTAVRNGLRPVDELRSKSVTPIVLPEASNELERAASNGFFSGDFRLAALASERLMQRYPASVSGWYWAVRANQKLAVAALTRAGELEPGSPRMHALIGDLYQRKKMFAEAEEEFSKMLAIAPGNLAALAGLANAYFGDGKLQQARETAQKALNQSPADCEVNLLMGEILVALHEYEEAEPHLRASLGARPDHLPRLHALLGRVLARTNRRAEAIEELKQGLESDEDGSVSYQLARLYFEAGDKQAAAAAFERSKQILARSLDLAQQTLAPVQ